ncbi:uncharacterized protein BX663DRAFT_437069, partial [Cokeromyces recurvatus]|uniref:uncharacterized protein n=1 Tax=Cokeromyces recurvatus TaxID=90255 RepID=UPI0022212683
FTSDDICKQESIYNSRVMCRFLNTVVMATRSCRFIPGETRLQAIKLELKRHELSTGNYYNADGIIVDKESDLELVLLEISGPFNLSDISRETTDHIKDAYARIWSFSLVKKELYVLNRVRSAKLPANQVDCKEELINVTNTMWELKNIIEHSCETLKKIKQSHEVNNQAIKENLPGSDKIVIH